MKKLSYSLFLNIQIGILILLAIMCLIEGIIHDVQPNSDSMGESIDFSQGWKDMEGHSISVDCFLKNDSIKYGETNYIYRPISSDIKPGYSLCFRSLSTNFVAYIGDKEILKPSYYSSPFSCNSTGSQWHFYQFKDEDIGKTLKIKFELFYNDKSSYFDNMYVCKADKYILSHLTSKISELITCIIMLFLGVFFVISGFYVKYSLKVNRHALTLLGVFACILSIWCLVESHIIELFYSCSQLVQFISCNLLYLLPIPAIMFADVLINSQHKNFVKNLCLFTLAMYTLAWGLQLANIQDFHESLYLSHISLLVSSLNIIILVIIERKNFINRRRSKKHRISKIIAFSVLFISVATDVLRFYISPHATSGSYLRFSMIFMLVLCGIIAIANIASISSELNNATIAKHLAYNDILTGVNNRTSFMEKINELEEHISEHPVIGVVVFDVNDLKHVNDTHGHQKGDELIVSAANIISKSFSNSDSSTVYRIGGDEFAVIIDSADAKAIYKISNIQFKANINNFNNFYDKPYTLSIAHGAYFHEGNETISLESCLKNADNIMYKDKQEYKKNHDINKNTQ